MQFIAVPVGCELPQGAVPVAMASGDDWSNNSHASYVSDAVGSEELGLAAPHGEPVLPAALSEEQARAHAPTASRRFNIYNPKTGEEVQGPVTRRGLRIVNPKTGEEVLGPGQKSTSGRSKSLRIVNPKTGEEVLPTRAKTDSQVY